MLDFHTHILPNIDDGSQSVEESILMLQKLKKQGCEVVAATPHFLADKDTPELFLKKRQKAYEDMTFIMEETMMSFPEILLGAEVLYYPGISRMSDLSSFCLEKSKLLLLEMPVSHWTEYVISELIEMTCSDEIRVVLAHFERYLDLQNKNVWSRLTDRGIMLQANASFFLNAKTRRKALKFLNKGQIHFLGSDCHSIKYRPPHIGSAISVIHDKFGKELIEDWKAFQYSFISTENKII